MKKLLFLALSILMMSASAFAWKRVPLTVSNEDPISLGNGNPRSPIEAPTVYIEDYSLSFEASHPDYVLYIKDEDGDVIYSTVVSSTQTQVVLPSTLSGDYQIELVMDYWLFMGWINL